MILLRVNGVDQGASPELWLACLAIGIGLGVAFAARIPDDPEPRT
jgi:hypothetical protein